METKDKPRKKEVNWLQAIPSIITAFVALLGIVVSFLTYSSTSADRTAQRLAADEDRAAQRLAARNERFTYAIEHLSSDSLAIRLGALYELKKLALEDEGLQEGIVRILGPFVRDGIENRELLPSKSFERRPQPQDDVFLACEIASLIYEQSGYSIPLEDLHAENLELSGIMLKGANLRRSNFNDAAFFSAQLQEAIFSGGFLVGTSFGQAQLQGAAFDASFLEAHFFEACLEGATFSDADLRGAYFKGAKGLTAEQILDAEILNEDTLLDPELRAEYDRLKAE